MIDPRLYRAALIPVIGAVVLLMFSLQPVPAPIEPPVSTPDFDARQAARLARSIAQSTPVREPGDEGDTELAAQVRERFSAIDGGSVAVQEIESSFDGDDVDLQNVILTLPGESEEVVLVLAPRDSAIGPGAASSAASTAALLSLADLLGDSRQQRTLVFASTSGGSDGGSGARELVDSIPAPEGFAATIVLEQMGVADVRSPSIIASDPDGGSIPAKLIETAAAIADGRLGSEPTRSGTWAQLVRLAIPVGLGEGAALASEGLEPITISGGGERLVDPDLDQISDISSETLAATGTVALDLVLTVDEATRPPADADAPGTYVMAGENLIPGWTLSVLAIVLIVPGLLSAGDSWLRERRHRPTATKRTLPWALERALIGVLPLVVIYALTLVGLIPGPSFPFEPDRFPAGAGAVAAFIAIAIVAALTALLIRPMRRPLDAEPHVLAASAGLLGGASLIGIWLLDPFVALLLSPLAHLWLLPARTTGPPRRAVVAGVLVVALLPLVAALLTVGSQLDLGLTLPWHLLLLISSGSIGPLMALLWCGLAGSVIAAIAAAGPRPRPVGEPAQRLRGPGGHVGPGSLGAGTGTSGDLNRV